MAATPGTEKRLHDLLRHCSKGLRRVTQAPATPWDCSSTIVGGAMAMRKDLRAAPNRLLGVSANFRFLLTVRLPEPMAYRPSGQ